MEEIKRMGLRGSGFVNLLLFCRTLLIASVLFPFYGYSQSIFSFKGEGESMLRGNTHMSALGYCEIPCTFSSNICGSIAFLKRTGIDLTYGGVRLEMKDEEGKNVMHYYGIPYIKVATTLPKDLAVGLNVIKVVDFNSNFITRPDSVNGVVFQEQFSKKGQLSVGTIEIAKKIGNRSGIGLGFNVLFGGSDEVWITNFSDTLYWDTRDSLNSSYFGCSYSLGIVLDVSPIKIGFGYSFPISCDKSTRSFSDFRKDTIKIEDELIFPSLYSGGCDLLIKENFNLIFTVRYEKWSDFKYNGTRRDEFRNVLSYSIGFEYNRIGGYKKRGFPLRVGYYSKPWYFKDSYKKDILDHGITLGTSIPVLQKGGFLDLGFIAGWRKTGELEERFYNLRIGFNFSERW